MGRILVVDDEIEVADTIASLLKFRGYETAIAITGLAALRIAQAQPIGLVLLDWNLPEKSGPGRPAAGEAAAPGVRQGRRGGGLRRSAGDQSGGGRPGVRLSAQAVRGLGSIACRRRVLAQELAVQHPRAPGGPILRRKTASSRAARAVPPHHLPGASPG